MSDEARTLIEKMEWLRKATNYATSCLDGWWSQDRINTQIEQVNEIIDEVIETIDQLL